MSSGLDPVWLRALSWVEAQRPAFAIPEAPPDACSLPHVKAVGELARTASVLLQQPALSADRRSRLTAILEHAWGAFREGSLFAEVLTARPELVMLGSLYSVFDRHGYVHEPTRSILGRLPERRQAAHARRPLDPRGGRIRLGPDSPVVLALGLAEAWRSLGLPSPWSTQQLFPRTLLARRLEGVITREAAYSITHTVYFITDFGNRSRALEAGERDHFQRACPGWMRHFLEVPNYDIYAELAFALSCTDGHDLDAEVEVVLAGAQDGEGMIPGPREGPAVESEGPGSPSFQRNYHSTLAALLASFGATEGLAPRPPGHASSS